MRVSAVPKPFKRSRLSTVRIEGTGHSATAGDRVGAVWLFLASAFATLTISMRTPLAAWAYAWAVMGGASWWTLCSANSPYATFRVLVRDIALVAIAGLGAVQWITGATVYRYATLESWTRAVALVATLALGEKVSANGSLKRIYLRAFAWFAAVVSVLAVAAYFTSPGKILWIFPSPYPDTWGPFLSRNDFAAFLELAFPVALWLGLGESKTNRNRTRHLGDVRYLYIAAGLLAAGIASASRAGSALLVAETIVIVLARGTRRWAVKFATAAVVLVALVGAGTLINRWAENDPMRVRREIQRSALEVIRERPIRGFGMGTFARVYPAYATFDLGAVVDHAHSDWLEWAAEGGLPYALAWLVVVVSVAKQAVRSVWGLGVLAVFLHASVDYPFARFGVSAWTMALIGALGAAEVREVKLRKVE